MRVLVTGVAGFLGSHLAEALRDEGHDVVGCDSLIGGEPTNVPDGVAFHRLDCTETPALRRLATGCEVVYHCAALAHDGFSVFSPALIAGNIVTASASVFSAAAACGVRRVVNCSSMARYGKAPPPFTEDLPPAPRSPYGIAKVAAEQMLASLAATHGFDWVTLVPHSIYGPRQKYDDPFRNVVSIMSNLMLQGRQPILYGDGSQQRCFSYITDCLPPLLRAATAPEAAGEIINIGPDEAPVSILDLTREIAALLDFPLDPVFVPDRPREVRRAWCSADKARRVLGYQTRVPLRQGLAATLNHIRRNGPRPFRYHLDLEILSDKTPLPWGQRLF